MSRSDQPSAVSRQPEERSNLTGSELGAAMIEYILILGLVTALALAVRGACRVIGAWRRRSASRSRGRKPPRQVAFYERLERILAQQGIKRGPRQTPLEFALRE